MSDQSDDDLTPRVRPTSDAALAAAKSIADISDDESEEERNPRPERPPTPMDEEPHLDEPREDVKKEIKMSPSLPESDEETTPRIMQSYEREAVSYEEQPRSLDIIFLPSSFSFPMAITTKVGEWPESQSPILYRLKPETHIEKSEVETLMAHIKNNPQIVALSDILESNANLITWSDGSKTLAIGKEQFRMIDDPMASKQFLFRRADDMQSFQGQINSVARVQPSAGGKTGKLAAVIERALKAKPAARTMLRCLEHGGEKEEEKAKQQSQRLLKDRNRLQAKRAKERARTRQHRPNPRLSARALESNDDDSGDEHVRQMEEHYDANRLLRAKRAAPPGRAGVSVKRQKAGGRRVLSYDDDDDDDDDDGGDYSD